MEKMFEKERIIKIGIKSSFVKTVLIPGKQVTRMGNLIFSPIGQKLETKSYVKSQLEDQVRLNFTEM